MPAGLRACELSGFRRLPTAHRFPARRASADGGGRSRLPLRGSPGFSPGSLLSPWAFAQGRQHEHQHIVVTFSCQPIYCGYLRIRSSAQRYSDRARPRPGNRIAPVRRSAPSAQQWARAPLRIERFQTFPGASAPRANLRSDREGRADQQVKPACFSRRAEATLERREVMIRSWAKARSAHGAGQETLKHP